MAVLLLIGKYITGPPLDLSLADGLRSGDNGGRLMLIGIGWGIFMARIAVGGFQHETNTFAPVEAPFSEFERHDGWPGLTRGDGLFDAVAGINLPVAGFIEAVTPALGAEVSGVDLRKPLDDATVAALRDALSESAVLFFRDQSIDVDQLCRFNWRPDSIAFRDNRCVQHMALWNYHPETRSGHRFTVA